MQNMKTWHNPLLIFISYVAKKKIEKGEIGFRITYSSGTGQINRMITVYQTSGDESFYSKKTTSRVVFCNDWYEYAEWFHQSRVRSIATAY